MTNGRRAISLPMCPNCGKPMILVRSVPKIGALPELRTYNCRSCGETVTEGDKPVQMRDGDDRAGRRLTLTPIAATYDAPRTENEGWVSLRSWHCCLPARSPRRRCSSLP